MESGVMEADEVIGFYSFLLNKSQMWVVYLPLLLIHNHSRKDYGLIFTFHKRNQTFCFKPNGLALAQPNLAAT